MSKKEHPVVRDWHGEAYNLTHCDKAKKSYDTEIQHVAHSRKRERFQNFFTDTYKRITKGERVSRDSVVQEAVIKGSGALAGTGDQHFYAFKKIPMRSYFWYSALNEGFIFVSHYRYKDYQKLASADTEKVRNNFFRYETKGEGNEQGN